MWAFTAIVVVSVTIDLDVAYRISSGFLLARLVIAIALISTTAVAFTTTWGITRELSVPSSVPTGASETLAWIEADWQFMSEQRIKVRNVVRIDRNQSKVVVTIVVHLVLILPDVASLCIGEPPVFDVGVELWEQKVCPELHPPEDEAFHEGRLVLVGDSVPGEPIRYDLLGSAPDNLPP